jgi:hypothetical protein
VFFISNAAFSWSSKRQDSPAGSTMEAEYIGLYNASNHAMWVNGFLSEIGFPLSKPLEIFCDNEAAIRIATGEELGFKRSKHINVRYHSIRDHVLKNEVMVSQVSSKENLADQFTKVLPRDHFISQSDDLGFEVFSDLE